MSALLNPLYIVGKAGYHLSRFCHYSGLSHTLIEMGMRTLPLAMVPQATLSLIYPVSLLSHKKVSYISDKRAVLFETAHASFIIAWALSAAFNLGDSLPSKLFYSGVNLSLAACLFNPNDKAKKILEAKYDSAPYDAKNILSKEVFTTWATYSSRIVSCSIILSDLPPLAPFFFPRLHSAIASLSPCAKLFF